MQSDARLGPTGLNSDRSVRMILVLRVKARMFVQSRRLRESLTDARPQWILSDVFCDSPDILPDDCRRPGLELGRLHIRPIPSLLVAAVDKGETFRWTGWVPHPSSFQSFFHLPPGMYSVEDGRRQQPDEETALLASPERKALKAPTPLPKLQIFVLLLMQLAEPITSNCIYPFINQVCIRLAVVLKLAG